MLDHNEFPYNCIFFPNYGLINKLIFNIFPELKFAYFEIESNLDYDFVIHKIPNDHFIDYSNINSVISEIRIEKEISDYSQYLKIYFQSEISRSFKNIKSDNRDYFFSQLINHCNLSSNFYKASLEMAFENILNCTIQMLLQNNMSNKEYLQSQFSEFVPSIIKFFDKPNNIIDIKIDIPYNNIFTNKETQSWFFGAMDDLGWNNSKMYGYQAKVLSFFDCSECRVLIFKNGTSKKEFVQFLNILHNETVIKISSNYSKSDSAVLDLLKYISSHKIPSNKIE